MQEVFEKIKERLKKEVIALEDNYGDLVECIPSKVVFEIVNQVAEEYVGKTDTFGNSEQVNKGWIPCSERLPEPGEIVLVCQTYSWEQFENKAAVTIGRLSTGQRQYWEFQYYQPDFRTGTIMNNAIICPGDEYVIAWQPLPEPYKGE